MKKSIFAILLCLVTMTVFAQRGENGNKGDRLVKELNLTAEQQEQMKAVRDNNRGAAKAIRDSDLSKEEKRAGMNALHNEIRNEVSSILSETQLEQWDAVQSQRRNGKMEKRQMMRDLDLSEDQKSALKSINELRKKELQRIRESDVSKEEKRAQQKEIHSASDAQVREVLTDDQYKIWHASQGSRHRRHG